MLLHKQGQAAFALHAVVASGKTRADTILLALFIQSALVPRFLLCSEADRQSKFVKLADEAFCIGPPPARESYLKGDVILDVAKRVGVDAIHPGEGGCFGPRAGLQLWTEGGGHFVHDTALGCGRKTPRQAVHCNEPSRAASVGRGRGSWTCKAPA